MIVLVRPLNKDERPLAATRPFVAAISPPRPCCVLPRYEVICLRYPRQACKVAHGNIHSLTPHSAWIFRRGSSLYLGAGRPDILRDLPDTVDVVESMAPECSGVEIGQTEEAITVAARIHVRNSDTFARTISHQIPGSTYTRYAANCCLGPLDLPSPNDLELSLCSLRHSRI